MELLVYAQLVKDPTDKEDVLDVQLRIVKFVHHLLIWYANLAIQHLMLLQVVIVAIIQENIKFVNLEMALMRMEFVMPAKSKIANDAMHL